jgi:hypothetical protein
MSIVVENEQEIAREGLDVLVKHLPPSKVTRLLGSGALAGEITLRIAAGFLPAKL